MRLLQPGVVTLPSWRLFEASWESVEGDKKNWTFWLSDINQGVCTTTSIRLIACIIFVAFQLHKT